MQTPKRISISVPTKRFPHWRTKTYAQFRKHKTVQSALNRVVRELGELRFGASIRVVYKDGDNETADSRDKSYLLTTLACFLEDHITKQMQKELPTRTYTPRDMSHLKGKGLIKFRKKSNE
jgi:hypothetical protein